MPIKRSRELKSLNYARLKYRLVPIQSKLKHQLFWINPAVIYRTKGTCDQWEEIHNNYCIKFTLELVHQQEAEERPMSMARSEEELWLLASMLLSSCIFREGLGLDRKALVQTFRFSLSTQRRDKTHHLTLICPSASYWEMTCNLKGKGQWGFLLCFWKPIYNHKRISQQIEHGCCATLALFFPSLQPRWGVDSGLRCYYEYCVLSDLNGDTI